MFTTVKQKLKSTISESYLNKARKIISLNKLICQDIRSNMLGQIFPMKPTVLNMLVNVVCNSRCQMCLISAPTSPTTAPPPVPTIAPADNTCFKPKILPNTNVKLIFDSVQQYTAAVYQAHFGFKFPEGGISRSTFCSNAKWTNISEPVGL